MKKILGFTLVELLIYMGLLMGFLSVISAVFSITLSAQTDAVQSQQIEQDSQYVIAKLQYDIQNADAIMTPASNGTTLSSFSIDVSGVTRTYSVQDEQLVQTEGSSVQVLTSPDTRVMAFSVLRLGNTDGLSTLTIDATLQNILATETRDLTFTTGVRQ